MSDMYLVRTTSEAENVLKRLKKTYKRFITQAFKDLKENPFIGKALKEDLEGRYSYRIGVYRIIYTVNVKEKIVNLISVKHRSIAYQ